MFAIGISIGTKSRIGMSEGIPSEGLGMRIPYSELYNLGLTDSLL